ncbi:uncharacterized protein EDB93DRAFT_1253233 [Suillus bovinus]|uniref:uncharacterized protein n=1 Tax=Suillus bovinus TaxID=48563 RepID=UPI001B86F5A8|nr:uncharacterized protein EDB93DRAFT_1253233 [Suillus bovinus]KAG2138684.1 hypothetical protein EDB93DRAFT_1253233 [Suillus bovinus]
MSNDDHPRTDLNNELQRVYGPFVSHHVRWEVYSRGPANALTWYATVYINDMNYGTASSHNKSGAQDDAARQARDNWRRERSNQ